MKDEGEYISPLSLIFNPVSRLFHPLSSQNTFHPLTLILCLLSFIQRLFREPQLNSAHQVIHNWHNNQRKECCKT